MAKVQFKIQVFPKMTPCQLVNSNHSIGNILPKLPKKFLGGCIDSGNEKVASSETSLNLCYSTWRRLKDDFSLPYVISQFIDFFLCSCCY